MKWVLIFCFSYGVLVFYIYFIQSRLLFFPDQTPFTSITQLAQGHYPFLPIRWILRFPFPAEEWASKITTPVFVFHGTKDEIIPFKMGQEQFNKFSSKNKEFLEVSSAKHNDLLFVAGPELWKKIDAFLSLSTL